MADHYANFYQDEDGWDFVFCECGWTSPPCPDVEIANGFFTDHIVATERANQAATSPPLTQQYDGRPGASEASS